MPAIAESLKSVLWRLIDYAGLYPPAGLPLSVVAEKYEGYQASPDHWILNRLVLPLAKLQEATLGENWRVTLIVDHEPGPLPAQIETLETKGIGRLSLPTYCEAPLDQIAGGFVKVRTGGLMPEATPSAEQLAAFLCQAAARRIPFKATAGLHHPIRSATMHGFLNVFVGAAFAWHGMDRDTLIELLEDTDATDFRFQDDGLAWRGHSLSTPQMRAARQDFAHSFGSCSIGEPLSDLREMGLLP